MFSQKRNKSTCTVHAAVASVCNYWAFTREDHNIIAVTVDQSQIWLRQIAIAGCSYRTRPRDPASDRIYRGRVDYHIIRMHRCAGRVDTSSV